MPRRRRLQKLLSRFASAVSEAAFFVAPQAVGRRRAIRDQLAFQRRMQARVESEFFASRRSADTDRLRGNKWLTQRLAPNSELEADLETVRDRAFDLALNEPVVAGYIKTKVTNVVGTGIRHQARIRHAAAGDGSPDKSGSSPGRNRGRLRLRNLSAEEVERLNGDIDRLMERQFRRIDRSGRKSLWRLQRLVERCYARDGEVLIVFSDKIRPGAPLPCCIEVIAGTRLATPPEEEGSPRVRMGVKTAEDGTPLSYFIRTHPPNDTKECEEEYEEVPAHRVCHLYEEEEPDQGRGWPGCQSTMPTLKDLSDFEEATLIGKQVAACFAVFIKTNNSPHNVAAGAATGTNAYGDREEQLAPGMIYRMQTGEEADFSNPSQGGTEHAAYTEAQYHRVAAGLGISYEALMKRFGRTNYSAARSVRLDDQEEYRVDQRMIVDVFLDELYKRCLDQAVALGLLDVDPRDYLAYREDYQEHTWIPTGWKWVDPLREVRANSEAIDTDQTTRTRVNAAQGMDDEERARERLAERMRDARYEKAIRDYRQNVLKLDPEPDPDKRTGGRTQTPASRWLDTAVDEESIDELREAAAEAIRTLEQDQAQLRAQIKAIASSPGP